MGKKVSYINTEDRSNARMQYGSDPARLYGQIRKLEEEIASLRKNGYGSSKRIGLVEEKLDWPNVVII